jgi:hypothetical protein
LVSYPKIVFLYPVFFVSLLAATYMSVLDPIEQPAPPGAAIPNFDQGVVVSIIFLVALGLNLVILAFDFPRATSLTLFFIAVTIILGAIILFMKKPDLLPALTAWLAGFRPFASATFLWGFAGILGTILLVSLALLPFDYWEVRRNELLHHHGILSNLERFPAPNLRIDKEVNDVFEYILLGSGRLIVHVSTERRAIILDNVPFIKRKEAALTRMLGALHVEVDEHDHSGPAS